MGIVLQRNRLSSRQGLHRPVTLVSGHHGSGARRGRPLPQSKLTLTTLTTRANRNVVEKRFVPHVGRSQVEFGRRRFLRVVEEGFLVARQDDLLFAVLPRMFLVFGRGWRGSKPCHVTRLLVVRRETLGDFALAALLGITAAL